MASFTQSDDLQGAAFTDVNLSGARFVRCDLSGVVLRAAEVAGADIDAPWLLAGENSLLVNGVNVAPYVDAELNRRFPGRELRLADNPEALRTAWAAIEHAWATATDQVAAMSAGTADLSVDGEWSFAQTLRHLVMATNTWFGGAILGVAQPFHPLGQPNAEYETDGLDMSVFSATKPSYDEVLAVRAEHVAQVRDYLATVTAADLAGARKNPWAPQYPETVLSCLHTILEEEWEHLRYASRDLATLS
ncbi:DinB family protein [Kribbella antibiotica]|uniref:DinB family protein n=1 Tax=Kribbella antibiotica TaxID=190195 RepID=A0A4R4ZMI6_9ACTN|nr:DinB family protein [Kribbella antibiotica]TDD59450.1 DinB family protein [Kribbella antibiotica]